MRQERRILHRVGWAFHNDGALARRESTVLLLGREGEFYQLSKIALTKQG